MHLAYHVSCPFSVLSRVILLSAPAKAFVPARARHTTAAADRWMSTSSDGEGASDFDPLLSPHAYPNGIDNGAVWSESMDVGGSSSVATSSFGFQSVEYQEINISSGTISRRVQTISTHDDFDPTLSPHFYANGIDAGAVVNEKSRDDAKQGKLGILLIDHGSKREASNEHLHNLAKIYQHNFNENNRGEAGEAVVRGAHMEIATPSILTSLRDLIIEDQVKRIVCVPYFLSPGRHAIVDVPNLISEATAALDEEGVMTLGEHEKIEVILSDALGTHTESMLGAVDKLVDLALDKLKA